MAEVELCYRSDYLEGMIFYDSKNHELDRIGYIGWFANGRKVQIGAGERVVGVTGLDCEMGERF